MRIGTIQSLHDGLNGILDGQFEVNKTQQQISSGRRVLTPGDDPIAATKILQLKQDLAQRDQYKRNMTAAENRLKLEEASLGTISNNLIRLRELTVQAGDGSLSIKDRQAIAAEVKQIQGGLVNLFNTQDAGGQYIFSGFKGNDQPFVQNRNGRFDFHGDEGQRFLAIGHTTSVPTGDNGKGLFVNIKAAEHTFITQTSPRNHGTGVISAGFVVDTEKYAAFYPDDLTVTFNPEDAVSPPKVTYTIRRASDNRVVEGLDKMPFSGGKAIAVAGIEIKIHGEPKPGDQFLAKSSPRQSITDTIFRLSEGLDALQDNKMDAPALKKLVADTLVNLDNAQTSVSETQSKIGARLNVVSNTRSMTEDVDLVSKSVLSKLSDVDLAEAASRLSFQKLVLEAAQRSYTAISQLSLINQL